MNTIEKIRQENLKTDIPEMGIGDTVEVGFRIKEGGKERVQNFTGVIISRHGTGIAQTITLRRVRAGQGVERVVPIHSPLVASFKVTRQGTAANLVNTCDALDAEGLLQLKWIRYARHVQAISGMRQTSPQKQKGTKDPAEPRALV